MQDQRPLVLDVDGTFLRTDMLHENFWAGMGRDPIATIRSVVMHGRDPSRLKAALVEIAPIRTDLLPVNPVILQMARDAQAEGREVILASASDARLVQDLSRHYDLDGSLGSVPGHNLKGPQKAAALVEAYGEQGYLYAGDDPSDLAVWEKGSHAIIVGRAGGAAEKLARHRDGLTKVAGGWRVADLFKAIRPHQWVKNVLLVLPMLAAHNFSLSTLLLVLLGMAAFSAAASCIYLVNDLLDLEADRLHAKKKHRPFAAGKVPLAVGFTATLGLGAIAIGLGSLLGPWFLLTVVVYMMLSLAYSLRLKRMRWVDIFTLAALYTLRVVAGAAASQVDASVFMLIFIFPIFVTLGCVKRMTELALAANDDRLPGRGYGRRDREDLLNVAGLGMAGALVIFFLYSFSDQARALYPTQWLMWAALVPIAAWMFRMIRLGWFGKQDYDPIVFALKDKRGIGMLLITLALMFYAAGLWQRWFGF